MEKLYKILFFMLLILGIEKYGFGYGFEGKATKPSPKTNQSATASQPKTGYLSSKFSSLWSSKPKETILPHDQQTAKEFDAITIPDTAQTNSQLLELKRQQNFLQNSQKQQRNILNSSDPIEQQAMLDAPVQKSSGWSFFSPRPKLSSENLQKSNSIKSSSSRSTELSDTASISSDGSLDLSSLSQTNSTKSPSPIMDYMGDSYQSFMNKANNVATNAEIAVTSVKTAITPEPVAPVRPQTNYGTTIRTPREVEAGNNEYVIINKAWKEARKNGQKISYVDFADKFLGDLDGQNEKPLTPPTTVKQGSWSKNTSQNNWEQQHGLYQTN